MSENRQKIMDEAGGYLHRLHPHLNQKQNGNSDAQVENEQTLVVYDQKDHEHAV